MKDTVLLIGCAGQIGTELTMRLREMYGNDYVIATDIREAAPEVMESGPFEILDGKDQEKINELVKKYKVTQVYLLAAMLSATAERHMEVAWSLNMRTLSHVLDMGREKVIKKIYWPSSIAVFGPNTPRVMTPQHTVMDPNTVYGISKLAGERWCDYYFQKFGVDVRSIRYPGIISWKADPGGGTTDYAVEIFHKALKEGKYTSFLSEDTELPMMYMPDALDATINLMEAPAENIKIRSSYNVAGVSFTPKQVAEAIQKRLPGFEMSYAPDYRQAIADSWPKSIDDSVARAEWGWKHQYGLDEIVDDMLTNLSKKFKMEGVS